MAQQNQNKVSTQKFIAQGGNCDCASAPIWMTALFDDEGSASQMQGAREHLKSCSSCSRVWREWSNTRSLMRSAVVPVVPASLLERVLLSCRLLPNQDAIAQSALENEIAFEELARYISAPEAEYSEDFSAPLAGFFGDAAMPADLKSRILQLTTEAEVSRENAPVAGSVSLTPIWQSWSETAREWSLPRAGRWGFALAVPAMAAWVLMVAPPANITPVAPNGVTKTFQDSPSFSSSAASIFPKNLLPNTMKSAVEKVMALKPALKPEAVIASKPVVTSTSVESNREDHSDLVSQPTPQLISATTSSSPLKPGSLLQTVKPAPKVKLVVAPVNMVARQKSRRKPVMDMARTSRPRLLPVTFSSKAQSLEDALLKRLPSGEGRQVSTLDNVEPRKSAATLIASSEFDETLESVGRLRDDRPEELGHAVDIYRASLLDQGDSDGSEDDEFYDQL